MFDLVFSFCPSCACRFILVQASYLSYDVWNEDKTTFMIAYEDLRDHIIKFGKEGVEESAINFIRDCNPTEEQRASLIKLLKPTRFATTADCIPGVCGPHCDCLVPKTFLPIRNPKPEVFSLRSYSSSFPPTKPICRKDDPRKRIASIHNHTNPWVTASSDNELDEQLDECSDDDSVFSFMEEYLRCLNRLAEGEIWFRSIFARPSIKRRISFIFVSVFVFAFAT